MSTEPQDTLISIEDACSMLRRKPQRNDRPYIFTTTKLNNQDVDEWKEKVLRYMCDEKGCIPSSKVWRSWNLFNEGRSIKMYMALRNKGMFPEPPKEVVEYWKDFFEKLDIEEIHSYGLATITSGWEILVSYIKQYYAREKYVNVYSLSDDPVEWEKNYTKNRDLFEGKSSHPFWDEDTMKDIHQKVHTLLTNTVRPTN